MIKESGTIEAKKPIEKANNDVSKNALIEEVWEPVSRINPKNDSGRPLRQVNQRSD